MVYRETFLVNPDALFISSLSSRIASMELIDVQGSIGVAYVEEEGRIHIPAVVPSSRRWQYFQLVAKEGEPGCPKKGKWPPRGTEKVSVAVSGFSRRDTTVSQLA